MEFDFIKKARERHGSKYDYSKTEYRDSCSKVLIGCPEHGEFWQRASTHLRGSGCPKCAIGKSAYSRTGNTAEFVEKAKRIHGNRYTYENVDYSGSKTKVEIYCPKHGNFWQTPNAHLKGQGCPVCKSEKQSSRQLSGFREFETLAHKVHGNRYLYDSGTFSGTKGKMRITCPEHGEFFQIAGDHIYRANGCPQCSNTRKGNSHSLSEFVDLAKHIHPQKYDYSCSEYTGSQNKLEIICPKHGSFFQRPNDHLQGQGCPRCACIGKSKMEDELADLVLEILKNV